MDINNKTQKSGDNSVNIQSENITINNGLSIAHVKEIALEIFEGNFYKLTGIAKETADQRAREITEKFVNELKEKNPSGILAAEDPDFQHSLFMIQKEYAKCGDKELGDILVDILVDRTKENERSLLQIVLNESLTVAPKLNSAQLDIIACCFNVAYTRKTRITSLQVFGDYLTNGILVFSQAIKSKDSNYKHLEYIGCIAIRAGERNIISTLHINYQAIFCKGYSIDAIQHIIARDPQALTVHIPCPHNPNLMQAAGMDDDMIRSSCITAGVSEDSILQIIQINKDNLMNYDETLIFLERISPGFKNFLEDAKNSQFLNFELTSVGIAIAHAHSRKKAGFNADLSIWI